MSTDAVHRFEESFAPRIAATLARQFGANVRVEVVPCEGRGHPTRVLIRAAPESPRHPYAYALNVALTWDVDEIERLLEPDGEARFVHYLDALERKIAAWETARPVDFASRTQAEPEVLLGGLDFEG
ncbi:DUF5594 family protein [Paraburkholderia acidisoli]|uniref:DUF5594 domain-containing protein n=1 Tax=Paraburkholderia acidisoli TaxID=2571748 RepID=A0A7Z2GFC1_9BURK|nr:DUF5594 family protein [Paraburkholderia acidisoli]QGZ60751.1 hypothetical protein FAZ98_02805 [Paraburkholderia acidisoli]